MAKEMKALTINGETYEIVDEYARSHSGSGSSAELEDIRLGADGKKFGTAGEAVRQQFRYVGGQIDHIEEEIQNIDSVFEDICYDSDGYKYPTPGDTIRMQFDSVKHSMENIDESIDHVIDLFDIIHEEVYDARIGTDGVEYETAGEAVRTQFGAINNKVDEVRNLLTKKVLKHRVIVNDTKCAAFGYINLNDPMLLYSYVGTEGNAVIFNHGSADDFADCSPLLPPGVIFSIDPNSYTAKNSKDGTHGLVVLDGNYNVLKIVHMSEFAENGFKYEMPYGGYILSFFTSNSYNAIAYEIYSIEMCSSLKPFVLDAESEYLQDPTFGDEALDAILSGRQILVRVLNASGDNYVATYSPIYMYQLPNDKNNYLYLFYLKDEKQNIDLSALGLGTIQVPLYGELKLLLSENYNKTPLE